MPAVSILNNCKLPITTNKNHAYLSYQLLMALVCGFSHDFRTFIEWLASSAVDLENTHNNQCNNCKQLARICSEMKTNFRKSKMPSIRQIFAFSNAHCCHFLDPNFTWQHCRQYTVMRQFVCVESVGLAHAQRFAHTHHQTIVAKCETFLPTASYHLSDKKARRIPSAAPQCYRSSVLDACSSNSAGHRPTEPAAEWQTDWHFD